MAWNVLQSASMNVGTGGTPAVAFTSNLSSGTKLLAVISMGQSTAITSVKDTAGNLFTQAAISTASDSTTLAVYQLDTPAGDVGATTTITVTGTVVGGAALLIQEVSGVGTGTGVDGLAGTASGNHTNSFTPATPSYASTDTDEYLLNIYGDDGDGGGFTWTAPGGGYTADANSQPSSNGNAGLAVAYKNSTNGTETGGYSLAGTGTTSWNTLIVAFPLTPTLGDPSPLQSAGVSAVTGASPAVAFTANLQADTKIIAFLTVSQSSTLTSVKLNDTAVTALTQVAKHSAADLTTLAIYAADTPADAVGTKPTVTATISGGGGGALVIQEVPSLATGTGTDGAAVFTSGNNTAPFTPATPSYATTGVGEYLVAVYADDGDGGADTWTKPAGYTADPASINANGNADLAVCYKNSTGGTETDGFTVAGSGTTSWNVVMVAFPLATACGAVAAARPGKTWRRRFRHPQYLVSPSVAGAVTITGTAAADAAGTATAVATQAAGTLTAAAGAGSASALAVQAATAAAAGAGTVTAAGSAAIFGTATSAAAGAVTAVVTQIAPATAAGAAAAATVVTQIVGGAAAGAASASAKAVQAAVAAAAGASAVTDVATQIATASVAGAGSVTAVGASSGAATASVAGAGSVTAVATQIAPAAAAGAGAVTAAATQIAGVTAAGAGAASALAVQAAIATAAGAGAVTDVATQAATATAAGAGSVTAVGTSSGAATATAAGAGAVTAKATHIAPATSAGAGAASALAVQAAVAAAAGAGAVTAAGTSSGAATATVAGAGAVTAVATQGVTAATAGAGSVTPLAAQIAKATAAAAATVNASGAITGTASMAGAATVTAKAAQSAPAAAAGAAALSALATQRATATITGTATVTAAGVIQLAFTIGVLTATDKPGSVLTPAGTSSVLTAATAAGSTLTATDQRTGGPG